MLPAIIRTGLVLLIMFGGVALRAAQAQGGAGAAARVAPATISGRVTADEKGVQNITVGLRPAEVSSRSTLLMRATTDAEGFYQLANVPPGRYLLMAMAPAFVVTNVTGWMPGKPINVSAGETVENIDFTLTRGGVITGRVTESDGKPIIAERVHINSPDERTRSLISSVRLAFSHFQTDDRGVYRIFGLPAGRYYVSVGEDRQSGMVRMGGPANYYLRVYHPDAASEAQARIVELTEGGEATDIDITVGKPARTFKARGRFLFADTEQPASSIAFGWGAIEPNSKRVGAFSGGMFTNSRGEFLINTLVPGRYAVFIYNNQSSELYSDPTIFEIDDADVDNLEVKVHRGASISGVVTIEGISDRAALARIMQQVALAAHTSDAGLVMPTFSSTKLNGDGSFQITGVRPGKVHITLGGYPPVRGLWLVRVEREGAEVRGGLDITSGAQVTGVRVHLAYGTGVVRGQAILRQGDTTIAPPRGTRMFVSAERTGAGQQMMIRPTEADERGRFTLEGLPPGEYTLTLRAMGPHMRSLTSRERVVLAEGGEATLTITLDLNATDKDKGLNP